MFGDGFAEFAQCGFRWWQRQVQSVGAAGDRRQKYDEKIGTKKN